MRLRRGCEGSLQQPKAVLTERFEFHTFDPSSQWMQIAPKAIISLEGYIRKIAKLTSDNSGIQLFFRGHSSVEYKIEPSVFRNANHLDAEHLMIRQLISQHPKDFSDDLTLFDRLVRAQHYGLPTRLLDISLNPLVALYFSVCSSATKRASVIVVKPDIGGQKYYDSDTVACLAALSLISNGEKQRLRDWIVDWRKRNRRARKANAADLAAFNELPEVQKLVQTVRLTQPDFRPIVEPYDVWKPVLVTPKKIHSRIIAQNGAFIIFGLGKKNPNLDLPGISFEEIHIEQTAKQRFLSELAQVGITESSLFPEIEKAAIAVKNRYK